MTHDKHINRIWRYRKERHLSQKHVAYLMGHKKASQVSVWESGEDLPTLENALMLGYILDASVEQLYPDLRPNRRSMNAPHKGRRSTNASMTNMTEALSSQSRRILAIDPGTRFIGIAFFVGTDLVRADVERNVRYALISPEDLHDKIERILARWITRYHPEVVALEKLQFSQSKRSPLLGRVVKEMKGCCKRKGVSVEEYAPMAVRRFLCKERRPTRLNVARVISTEYFRWLHPYYEKETAKGWWRPPYWLSMFDAIALGLACHARHTAKEQKRPAA